MPTVFCDASFNYGGLSVTLPVFDGRGIAPDQLPFEECGFQLIEHASSVADWSDERAVDSIGRDEFGELAQAFTGCDAVAVYPVICRNPATAATVADYAPILFVHSDYTDDYQPMVTESDRRYANFLVPALRRYGLSHDDVRSASRLMMLQEWRNTGPVRPDYPLAFCDARDVTAPHRRTPILIPEYGGERLDFEAFAFFAPGSGETDHWYTFPSLRGDEAVLLRTYDSARAAAGLPFWTPHSAFRDPGVPDGPEHHRASVELRALCLWQ